MGKHSEADPPPDPAKRRPKAERQVVKLAATAEVERQRAARAARKAESTRARLAREEAERQRLEEDRRRLSDELEELRRSYYLSGAAKKIDIAELEDFTAVARPVIDDGRTNMKLDRLYTLWQAARAAPAGSATVEVGTYKGGSARFIAEAFRRAGRQERLYVCDTFTGHPRTDPTLDPTHHGSHKFQDTSAESVAAYLAEYPNVEVVVGDIVETHRLLRRARFGLVHIDVDVYPATDFCLRFFAPRLADGGVIVVDDYGFLTCPGAKRAVDDFIAEGTEFRMFHLLTGQALVFRQRRGSRLRRLLR